MANILTILQQFSSFGIDFPAGAIIDSAITETWPEGTLDRRLDNKFLKFVGSDVTHVLAEVTDLNGAKVLQYVPIGSEPEAAPATPSTPATPATPATPEDNLTDEQKFQLLLDEEEKRKAQGN